MSQIEKLQKSRNGQTGSSKHNLRITTINWLPSRTALPFGWNRAGVIARVTYPTQEDSQLKITNITNNKKSRRGG
jgi:hypothetical protein